MDQNLPYKVKQVIRHHTDAILGDVLWDIEQKEVSDFEECRDIIDDTHHDDAAAIELDLDEQLSLLEYHAEDYEIEPGDVSFDTLRRKIEECAALAVVYVATSEAREAIDRLEEFMDKHDFEFENLSTASTYEWARHWGEREEGDRCQVYEYRDVEGEIHVDLFEYQLTQSLRVYLPDSKA